ncbi:Pop1p [Sugiyamaella lignohabitans]|uniref:Pop1p n=1 Tax=Sugiyamaella lignohabitans TaxID=796027 RepID=A0A167DJK4_9ASCO|nr:Pop1p [Sugiyamaella lignohabitans]ANB12984.1 Pop1p [Sugiyamaella lignohabitans]
MAPESSSKRDVSYAPNGHDRRKQKRAKLMQARSIIAQNTDDALVDGRLDVPSFIKSRQFEIERLESAMLSSKSSGKKRIFQSLPRVLRRRTASHNVKRVPKRMRERAAYEMQNDNDGLASTISPNEKKKLKLKRKAKQKEASKIMKSASQEMDAEVDVDEMDVDRELKDHELKASSVEPLGLEESIDDTIYNLAENKKQADIANANKTDKFFGIASDLTGINRLAIAPKGKPKFRSRQKDKVWLPTHVWHSKRCHMENIWQYSIPKTPTQKCYRATHRAAAFAGPKAGTLAWDKSYFATFIIESALQDLLLDILRRLAGKMTPYNPDITQSRFTNGYRCWEGTLYDSDKPIGPGLIYFNRPGLDDQGETHRPSFLVRVHPSIAPATIDLLTRLKNEYDIGGGNLTFYDCRYSIGSIELLGPQSTNALISILRCADHNSKVSKLWRSLAGLANPSSLPENAVLSFAVHDPRLFYPPHKPQLTKASKSSEDPLADLLGNWPYEDVTKTSSLFSIQGRERSVTNQLTLKELYKRKAGNEPGKHLSPQTNDPRIPIILMRQKTKDGWTLLAPWGWILPIWFCLMHFPEVQVSGYTQEHQISYEHGRAHFPDDFPDTDVGNVVNLVKGKEAFAKWNGRPPAKRVAFDKIKTGNTGLGEHGNPFLCDWKFLAAVQNKSDSPDNDQPTSVAGNDSLLVDDETVERCVTTSGESHLLPITTVHIKYIQRGSPHDRARIYRIPAKSVWEFVVNAINNKQQVDLKQSLPCPSCDDLIGYITTGDFNLASGCGTGIGGILDTHAKKSSNYCLVRNVGTSTVRLARWVKI